MKKYLAIAALLASVSTGALAQTVTLYGTLDASVHHINNANAAKNNSISLVDSSMASSVWGLRGSEDLGGGMRATFNLESDIQTNNGGTNQNGLFRRAANVGLVTSLGHIELGVKMNPLIAANSTLMPLSGHGFSTITAAAMGYADFFTRNAVTYTSPSILGLTAQLQYGASNSVGEDANGSVVAASLAYKLQNLTVTAAAQERQAGGTASSANGVNGNKQTQLVGAKYALGNLTVGAAYITNDQAGAKVDATQVGASYQMSPRATVAVNYAVTDADSNLTNVQARYALGRRTTLYSQVGHARNGSTAYAFQPAWTTTGNSPAVNVSGLAAAANTNQTAFGVGVIHSF